MNAPDKFYKVRSIASKKFLHGSRGFYGTRGTVYATIGGAKAGYTSYLQASRWRDVEAAEIVAYSVTESNVEVLPIPERVLHGWKL